MTSATLLSHPASADTAPTRDALLAEASALGAYVVGGDVEPDLLERYVAAHAHLDIATGEPDDVAVLEFAVRHRVTLPCLDAACALVRPSALLHRKALLMAAILETTPRYAERFLPRSTGWVALIALGARVGVTTVLQLVVGLPLLAFLRGRR
jgi:hypothetical protein